MYYITIKTIYQWLCSTCTGPVTLNHTFFLNSMPYAKFSNSHRISTCNLHNTTRPIRQLHALQGRLRVSNFLVQWQIGYKEKTRPTNYDKALMSSFQPYAEVPYFDNGLLPQQSTYQPHTTPISHDVYYALLYVYLSSIMAKRTTTVCIDI